MLSVYAICLALICMLINLKHSKLNLPRQSIISRQSVEMFLDSFPQNETEYADQEIMSAVKEIINADIGLSKEMSVVEMMRTIIRSHRFHLFYICLVILDCICVVLQMIIDIVHKRKKKDSSHSLVPSTAALTPSDNQHLDQSNVIHTNSLDIMEQSISILSMIILSIFLLSILFHAILLGKVYFKSKLEMFDAIIVISSFFLEIMSIVYEHKKYEEIEVAVITFRFVSLI